jgi:hypothetical protein
VHAVGVHALGKVDVIVDDEGRTVAPAQGAQRAGLLIAARGVVRLVAILHHRRAAAQGRRHAFRQGRTAQQRGVGQRIHATDGGRSFGCVHGVPANVQGLWE